MREKRTTGSRVAVVGAGQMGSGIAQVAATFGHRVTFYDVTDQAISLAFERIRNSLERLVRAGGLSTADAGGALERLEGTTILGDAVSSADYVFEAAPEIMTLKQDLLARVESLAPTDVILATNTSQLSPTEIAEAVQRPERVIATHWFNPPPIMRLVEVVRGERTSEETLGATLQLLGTMGKEVVVCKKDRPGFIVSRLLLAQRAEALRILEEGVATVEDIDKAIELGLNHPIGPFRLADATGLDTALLNLDSMTARLGGHYRATDVLREHVKAGRLGRKAGRGFYDYPKSR